MQKLLKALFVADFLIVCVLLDLRSMGIYEHPGAQSRFNSAIARLNAKLNVNPTSTAPASTQATASADVQDAATAIMGFEFVQQQNMATLKSLFAWAILALVANLVVLFPAMRQPSPTRTVAQK